MSNGPVVNINAVPAALRADTGNPPVDSDPALVYTSRIVRHLKGVVAALEELERHLRTPPAHE